MYEDICAWLERDFPRSERPPKAACLALMESGALAAYIHISEGKASAYGLVAVDREHGAALLSHFAVQPEKRGQGYGSAFLADILEIYAPLSMAAEAEDPDFAKDEADRRLRERRFAFYERLGFRPLPARYRIFGVSMRVLWFGGNEPPSLREAMRSVYRKLLPPSMIGQVEADS